MNISHALCTQHLLDDVPQGVVETNMVSAPWIDRLLAHTSGFVTGFDEVVFDGLETSGGSQHRYIHFMFWVLESIPKTLYCLHTSLNVTYQAPVVERCSCWSRGTVVLADKGHSASIGNMVRNWFQRLMFSHIAHHVRGIPALIASDDSPVVVVLQ